MTALMVPLRCPTRIGKNSSKFDIYKISQYTSEITKTFIWYQ